MADEVAGGDSPGSDPSSGLLAAGDPAAEARMRHGLRRMRVIATTLLAVMVTVYIIAWRWGASGAPGWVDYVAAAAEAGTVGALADWFAVTALFRHPLGLPIPHTAIIPHRKDALGRGLQSFVGTHFLAEDVVREKVDQLGVAARVGTWLRRPENAERITAEVSSRAAAMISGIEDDLVRELVEKSVLPRLLERRWAGALGLALDRVVTEGTHHHLVDLLVSEADEWLRANPDTVLRLVREQAPTWSPRWLDEAVAARAYAEALRFVADLRDDRGHRLRRAIDTFLLTFAERLRTDPELGEKVEALKRRIVAHPEADRAVTAIWVTARGVLLDLTTDPHGAARTRAAETLAAFGGRLVTEPELAATVDRAAADVATRAVRRYREDIAAVIGDTVARWEPAATSRRIELHVGRDLQFIRINGTVVGALAGLVIHLLTEVLL
ncbi:hypothetical protein CC117_18365 [Parafrankia colletiae]|uniref:DUF445 domain-containing protein n=1 Tax=Parafrankia colletiae TaxID=573497 RepID=A0A1S1QRG5_9ACTN|nr:DUF445 domain-containing protein [Parafrankia colletiae]MCK9904532.1 DUF445 domain-containing protein [Frankia sp. Cpl3]OHV36156.1 hypothetical protein CC117_18365 [Parafrankia colletiae]